MHGQRDLLDWQDENKKMREFEREEPAEKNSKQCSELLEIVTEWKKGRMG